MNEYRIPDSKHYDNRWRVQTLAADFILEDAWEFPIQFNEEDNDSLFLFRKHALEPMIKNLFNLSLSGMLFHFRAKIGDLFGIDKNVNTLPIPGCKEISLAERMTEDDKANHKPELDIQIGLDNYLYFQTVYSFENETLNELSNKTEHSLMHYCWIKKSHNLRKVQLAVYVKRRNWMGSFYMNLIRPFRHWIVYPYIFTESVKLWNEYKLKNRPSNKKTGTRYE